MEFKIDLERLTEEQLEALRKINNSVVETEIRRRKDTTYSDEEMRSHKVFSDLSKAYFFLKPMYDNMRNTDVKKTITQSEILPTLEKVFRYADQHKMAFEKYEGEPVVKEVAEPIMRPEAEPTPLEKAIEEATPTQAEIAPIVEPVIESSAADLVWEAGGGANIEQPTPVVTPVVTPVATPAPTAAPIDEIITSPVENMSTEELNKILANIPTVEKI